MFKLGPIYLVLIYFGAILPSYSIVFIKKPILRKLAVLPFILYYLGFGLIFEVANLLCRWVFAATGFVIAMKFMILGLSGSEYQTPRMYWARMIGFVDEQALISGQYSAVRQGFEKFGCMIIKYSLFHVIGTYLLIDPKVLLKMGYIESIPHYYLYGFSLYASISGIADAGIALNEIVLGVPMRYVFNAPFLATDPRDFCIFY